MAKIRAASNRVREILDGGWEFAEVALAPGAATGLALPQELGAADLAWTEAQVPGTVASSLRALSRFDFRTPKDFDDSEFWYRTRFPSRAAAPDETLRLVFGGLATLADVWLNGEHVLRSENMYLSHELDVTALVREDNELIVRFASLAAALAQKRPRPRFKTRMIDRQQLRWFRTTFLGRMPGWSPLCAPVGPFREVSLERHREFAVNGLHVLPRVEAGRALVSVRFAVADGRAIRGVGLRVGDATRALEKGREGEYAGELELAAFEAWWPHTHGAQPRYAASLEVTLASGQVEHLQLDPLAFRRLEVVDAERFALSINGVSLRCRGACWTPTDVVSLEDDAATRRTVAQARAAGMNMLRVGGTMIYESDAFYEECERLGILVWQDFMFANCDYPRDDAAFRTSVEVEARQFLDRTSTFASLAVLCGGSEVEQQISMLGLPRELWQPPLFEQDLRGLAASLRPDVPYVSSSPTGGPLPFQADTGVTHYYGVGAYLRPLEDARRADVKFAAECLAFANVPEAETLERLLGDVKAPFHEPLWKARVPRDNGAGWDFDDVRDHYVRLLFGEDPLQLRYQDPERALELARVTSGEVMARTLAEWRRGASACRGALIWFLRDLWPGAGWGLIDAEGIPKAAFYFVKRANAERAIILTDEGVNGLAIEVVNDAAEPLAAELELGLLRAGKVRIAHGACALNVPGRGSERVAASSLLEHFIDLTHAYRFGPPAYDVAYARLLCPRTREPLASEACFLPGGLARPRSEQLGLEAVASVLAAGTLEVQLTCSEFAHAVAVEVPGFLPDDSYFDLVPGCRKLITLSPRPGAKTPSTLRGHLRPLNAQQPTRITFAR